MSEIINNSASTTYILAGSENISSATSNSLPINLQNAEGLIITKTANKSTFSAGDIITYTVTITNSSGHYLNGVRIIDNLGNGNLAYVLGSASLTSTTTYPVTPIATNPLTFTLQQLAVGSTMTLTYKAQVIFNLPVSVSLITNNIRGIGYTSTGTINGYASCTIEKKTDNDFSITKSANVTEVIPLQSFMYKLTIRNNTSANANIVDVRDDLPNNFKLTGVTLKQGSSSTITLLPSEYILSSGNILTVPSSTGPTITVPANSTTILTLSGYFQ